MNTYINDQIYDKLRTHASPRAGAALGQEDFEFSDEMAQYYDIRSFILKKTSRVRMLLVLALKEITWYNELKIKYDIHHSHITEFFEYMKENNMILFRPLVEVEDVLFETVIKQNTEKFYNQREEVKVYTLTPEGKEMCNKLMEDIFKLMDERTDLKIHVDYIMSKTKLHRTIMKDIYDEETSNLSRKIQYPDGSLLEKKTLRSIKRDKEMASALKEIKKEILLTKQEQNLLTSIERTQLAKLEDTDYEVKGVECGPMPYKGEYSHLTKQELDTLISQEVSSKELDKINKEENEKAKKNMELLNAIEIEDDMTQFLVGGLHKRFREMYAPQDFKQNKDQGLDFLDALSDTTDKFI